MTSPRDTGEPDVFEAMFGDPAQGQVDRPRLAPVPDASGTGEHAAVVVDGDVSAGVAAPVPDPAPVSATYGGAGFTIIMIDGREKVAQVMGDGTLRIVGDVLTENSALSEPIADDAVLDVDAGEVVESDPGVLDQSPVNVPDAAERVPASNAGPIDDAAQENDALPSGDSAPVRFAAPSLPPLSARYREAIPSAAPRPRPTPTPQQDPHPQAHLEPRGQVALQSEPATAQNAAISTSPALVGGGAYPAPGPALSPVPTSHPPVNTPAPAVAPSQTVAAQAEPAPAQAVSAVVAPAYGWHAPQRAWQPYAAIRASMPAPKKRPFKKASTASDPLQNWVHHQMRLPLTNRAMFGVCSLKGGAAKTLTSLGISNRIAAIRGDNVALIDGDSDASTIGLRVHGADAPTWWAPLNDVEDGRFRSIFHYAVQVHGSPQFVFPGPNTPEERGLMTAGQWSDITRLFTRDFPIVVADTLTGLAVHPMAAALIRDLSGVALVGNAAYDALEVAGETYDYLASQGHGDLARNACVVVSLQSPPAGDEQQAIDNAYAMAASVFDPAARPIKDIVVVPHDPFLATGGPFQVERVRPEVLAAWEQAAAVLLSNVTIDPQAAASAPPQHQTPLIPGLR